MVLANVAAAEELERQHLPCMYRVHAPPSDEKLEALRSFLDGIGISLPPGDQLHPRDLDRVLRKAAGTADAPLVNEIVLRSQSGGIRRRQYRPFRPGFEPICAFHQPDPPLRRFAGAPRADLRA